MSLSDRFKSIINKKSDEKSDKPQRPAPPPLPSDAMPKSPTLEDLGKLIAKEKSDGEIKLQALENDLFSIRSTLGKMEITSRSSREAQGHELKLIQQDTEREIKAFEKRLADDMKNWDKQIKDREKILQDTHVKTEAEQQKEKASSIQEEQTALETADRAESLLKEQEVKLAAERKKWQDLLQVKETELVTFKQELLRRETTLENDLKQHQTQQTSAMELWQTRIKELERQWADKRKGWEEAMKTKEQERVKLNSTFLEKQASWQLEQERRLHEIALRQQRAQEKLSSLNAHVTKETQNWEELTKSREEQLQQLKVKMLLTESEAKGQLDQAQKALREAVANLSAQAQSIQHQIQEEQASWQKSMEAKEYEISQLKDDISGKLRRMEADFNQRIGTLTSEKDSLTKDYDTLLKQFQLAQKKSTDMTEKLKSEQIALEASHQKRIAEYKEKNATEQATLEAQVKSLEEQKATSERELATAQIRWQDEMRTRDQALKEAREAIAPQENELRKRFETQEEALTREMDAVRVKLRTVERDLLRAKESIDKTEKEQLTVIQALEDDHRHKEAALKERSIEVTDRLTKRVDERRIALEAFLAMKKDEEARIQGMLQAKEKERKSLATRLQTLPKELEETLLEKKKTAQKETENIKARTASLEGELATARAEAHSVIQAKATQLSALRQSLEAKHKEISSTLRAKEQVLESERAQIEKQITTGQGEIDRIRTHWQAEIEKKEKEITAMKVEMQQQEAQQAATLAEEEKRFVTELRPFEDQKLTVEETLARERKEFDEQIARLEKEKQDAQGDTKQLLEKERLEKSAMETRFRDERAKWKARVESLSSEREGVLKSGKEAFEERAGQIKQLEERLRAQAVAHETHRRDLLHQATLKSRTLQDIIRNIEQEIQSVEELQPRQIKERESMIAGLKTQLAEMQKKYQRTLDRFEKAMSAYDRRGKQKEDTLQKSLAATQEEWAKKLAERDSEIASLQSNLLGKESERQGELDRLAKQFAEERFQLEKAKEELEWKLKDRKEVSERQLSTRQKEISTIENEILRLKAQRDQEIGQKNSVFEAQKQTMQASLSSLQKRVQETRQTQEATLASKEQELQGMLTRSREHLKVLSEEFNRKVTMWRATNDTLKAQTEQLKVHVTQSQDHWETLRKEKSDQLGTLRQELAKCEAQIKNDSEEFDRVSNQQRLDLSVRIRTHEKELEVMVQDYEKKLQERDEEMARSADAVRGQEQKSEHEWQATLEQWQTDKQALQQEKATLEHELIDMQNRFQAELRQTDEAMSKLKMDITFREANMQTHKQRLQAQMERDLRPLEDRLGRLTSDLASERSNWETRIHAKDDELKMLKARLALREKRLQDEQHRRADEMDKLRKQVTEETAATRKLFEAEKADLEKQLAERRKELAQFTAQQTELHKGEIEGSSQISHMIEKRKADLEESLRRVIAEKEGLQEHFDALMASCEVETIQVQDALEAKSKELDDLRESAHKEADALRRKMDHLRQKGQRSVTKPGMTTAVVWKAFEEGVAAYQGREWDAAAKAFEKCIQKDAHWGAAYQYLALTYHAQGDLAKAMKVAERAIEFDPDNSQLASWVDRLQMSINERKAS